MPNELKVFLNEAEMLRDVINTLKEQNAKLLHCCEFTYEKVLEIPHESTWRIEHQYVLANLVSVIAEITGKKNQEVQEHYEEIALLSRLGKS